MIIKWKGTGIKTTPVKPNKKVSKKQLSGNPLLIWIPGVNEVHDGDWSLIKDSLERDIKTGLIEVCVESDSDEKPGKKVQSTLTKVDPTEAEELIKKCNNIDTLKKWKKYDKREDVRLMIVSRIDEIEAYINDPKN